MTVEMKSRKERELQIIQLLSKHKSMFLTKAKVKRVSHNGKSFSVGGMMFLLYSFVS